MTRATGALPHSFCLTPRVTVSSHARMQTRMLLPIGVLGAFSFVISWLLTALMIRVAPKFGFVDKPGHRKIHSNPKPLGGGVAITAAIVVPMILVLIALNVVTSAGSIDPAYFRGAALRTPLALVMLGGIIVLHVM